MSLHSYGNIPRRFGGQRAFRLARIVMLQLACAFPMRAQSPAPPPLAPPDTLALTLPAARQLALRQNPWFLAARRETAIASGDRRQARLYRFNPDLSIFSPGTPRRGTASPLEFAVTQEIEWAGQRGLRIDAADAGVARATSTVRNAERQTLAQVSLVYYRALAAIRRLDLAQQWATLAERLVGAVRTQLKEGEISTLESNLAEIEAGRARGRILTAQREATSARLELTLAIGVAPDAAIRLAEDQPIGAVPEDVSADSLVQLALRRRPDVAARRAGVREFSSLTSLARREGIPNLRLGGVRERDVGGPRFGFTAGISLPLLNRNQGLVARREAELEQATLLVRASELDARTEVTDAVRTYRIATEEASVFELSVLGPARRNSDLLETAYRAGKISLPSLLLLRNQLLDAELGYWAAWLAKREAIVRLEAATGSIASSPSDDANTSSTASAAARTK